MLSYNVDPRSLVKVGVNSDRIYKVLDDLVSMKLINNMNDLQVTKLGIKVSNLQLDVKSALFLVIWTDSGYDTYMGIVIASIISNDLSKLFNDRKCKYTGADTLHTVLNFWRDVVIMFPNILRINFKLSKTISRWCESNLISYSILRNIVDDIKSLSKAIRYNSSNNSNTTSTLSTTTSFTTTSTTLSSSVLSSSPEHKVIVADFDVGDIISKAISVFGKSHSDWIMSKSNEDYVNVLSKNKYSVSRNIPYTDSRSNQHIIGLSLVDLNNKRLISLFVFSSYDPLRYRDVNRRAVSDYEHIPMPSILQKSRSLRVNVDVERMYPVTVEQIGYNRSQFIVPPLLNFTMYNKDRGEITDIVRTRSLCLVPEFVGVIERKTTYRVSKEDYIEDDDEDEIMLIEEDENYYDRLLSSNFNYSQQETNIVLAPGDIEDRADLEYEYYDTNDIDTQPNVPLDPLISRQIHF